MSLMRNVHLRNVDLNLIYPLRALLEECHVTRAAKRSFLSQPAMSRALERLRDMFGDPLLVRNGRGYERTVQGERVLRDLESLMPRLEGMVRGETFDPARSQEVFRVAMSDHASMIALPSLLASVRQHLTSSWKYPRPGLRPMRMSRREESIRFFAQKRRPLRWSQKCSLPSILFVSLARLCRFVLAVLR